MGKWITSGQTGDPSKGALGGVNRRQVIKGAGAAGVTAAALPGLLSARGASAADYDPMKYARDRDQHPYDRATKTITERLTICCPR